MEQYRPQSVEFAKAYTCDYGSRADDTEKSQLRAISEKIIVHEGHIPRTEEPLKPRYPKNLDVGRIVIEEISEEQPRSKYPRQSKSTDSTTERELVKDISKPSELDDVYNVSKLDLGKLEPRKVESGTTIRMTEREKEWVERQGKACLNYLHGSMEINYQKI